jgi:glutamate N-acetyltransferase/amino-acid N-acetyltransferase
VNRGPSNAARRSSRRTARRRTRSCGRAGRSRRQVAAIVLNSGGANCFTGPEGFQVTHRTAEAAGAALGVSSGDVLVCSTGLIGEQLDGEVVEEGVLSAIARLTAEGGEDAARAIMTTDTTPKTVVVEGDGWRVGGIAKGAGHARAGLATMLVVLTTDALVPAAASTRRCAPRPA